MSTPGLFALRYHVPAHNTMRAVNSYDRTGLPSRESLSRSYGPCALRRPAAFPTWPLHAKPRPPLPRGTATQRILILVALACWVALGCAQDRYVVLDRASYRGLSLVDSGGGVTPLMPNVPWQHANSVARDAVGNFVVTVNVSDPQGSADGVYRVSLDGTVTPVAVGPPFDQPRGIAIDATGNCIVPNYIYNSGTTQLLRVSPAGQVEVLLEGRPLRQPVGIAIDAQGRYVITDRATAGRLYGVWTYLSENGAVYRFDPATRLMTTVRSSVDENGNVKFNDLLGHLAGVAIDGDGNYIIIEAPPHLDGDGNWKTPIGDTYLLRMRPDGEILQTIHIPTLNDRYTIGLDVAIDRQGNYIVADAVGISNEDGRLLRVTPAGQVTSIVLTTLLGIPGGVVVLPATAPPFPPQIVGLNLIAGAAPPRLRFSWQSEVGRQYRVQRSAMLDGEWQDLPFLISGTGEFIEFSDQCAGAASGFYRIRLVNPAGQSSLATGNTGVP